MKKRILAISLAMVLSLSFVGCGNAVPAINENDLGNKTEEVAEIIEEGASLDEFNDRVQEIKDGDITSTDKSAEVTESPEPTAMPSPTPTPEPTATPEPTPTPHMHDYTEVVIKQPSCSVAGQKTLTCSCGDTKTEAIPATGNHNWVEGTITIYHEALGHVENTEVQVQVGTATRTEYACAFCDARFDTPSGVVDHCIATGDRDHAVARTIAYDYPGDPIYETQTQSVWVVDKEAWDETVGNGVFTCSVCGATK